ncbi:MAG TPA: helix-turn-helix domain-containing protein [Vicinamibacterales bacterium]
MLWIDDDICPSSPDVRLLELEGFHIQCAVTGAAALALAPIGYDAILLDLMLPDIPGLTVLARLRADGVMTPVLVVTGFGDFESARVAGQLGVEGFQGKPVFANELSVSLDRLIRRRAAVSGNSNQKANVVDGLRIPSRRSLAALLEALQSLTRRLKDATVSVRHEATAYRALIGGVMRALLDPALPMPAFLACARALRLAINAGPYGSAWLAERIQIIVLDALEKPVPRDPRVIAALNALESAAAQGKRLKLEEIAKNHNVVPSHLSRLISRETGVDFTEWRTAFALRPSLAALTDTNEHVKQIACRLLGFNHPAQFDAEFRRFLGLSPSGFRAFSQHHP